MRYLNDYGRGATVRFRWSTNDTNGASVTRSTDGAIRVYKDGGTSYSTTGITDTEDFNGLAGVHLCEIDLTADSFYQPGHDYDVVLAGAVIDGQTVNAVIASFSVENRYPFATATSSSTSSGGVAGLTDGFLYKGIMLLRELLDEPDVNAKYTDARLIEYLESAYGDVLGEYNRNCPAPLLCYYDVTLANTTSRQWYALPPSVVGMIRMIELLDSNDNVVGRLRDRPMLSASGQGWRLEGHNLFVEEDRFTTGYKMRIYYIPTGTARLHEGTAAALTASTITLASSPSRGTLDMTPNAYGGSVVRILGADTNYVMQERIITDYDAQTRVATVRPDFDPVPSGTVNYEIGPILGAIFQKPMIWRAASAIAAMEWGMGAKYKALVAEEQRLLRTLRLNAANTNIFNGIAFRRDTVLAETDDNG